MAFKREIQGVVVKIAGEKPQVFWLKEKWFIQDIEKLLNALKNI